MLKILEFMFSSFWIWAGGVIYLLIIGDAVSGFIKIQINKIRKYAEKADESKDE